MNNGIHPTRKNARTIRPLIVRIPTQHPFARTSAYIEIARRFAKFDEAEKFDAAIASGIEALTAIKDESIKVASLVELDSLVEELKLDIAGEDLAFLKTILKDVPFE